jgi:hypothetical protein
MQVCVGDCNGDGSVMIDELLAGISILLGAVPPTQCPELDRNGDRLVTVDEMVTAVGVALTGCPDLPRFPVGAYFWPDRAFGQTGSALGDLAAFGLNTVVAYYEYVKPDVPPFSGQPDCHGLVREAETYGIDFFIGAPRGHQVRSLDEPALAARLQATIDCVGASPRYRGWMFDEPELTGYDAPLLERVIGLLRPLHREHRVWVNFSPFATDEQFQNLGATADIVGFDIYPISDVGPRPLTAVGEYTRRARDLAAPDTEVWMIVQPTRGGLPAQLSECRRADHILTRENKSIVGAQARDGFVASVGGRPMVGRLQGQGNNPWRGACARRTSDWPRHSSRRETPCGCIHSTAARCR